MDSLLARLARLVPLNFTGIAGEATEDGLESVPKLTGQALHTLGVAEEHQVISETGTYTVTALDGATNASEVFQLLYARVVYVSDVTAANRLLTIQVLTGADVEVFHTHAFAAQVASKTNHYYLLPGIFRETSGSTAETGVDANFQVPVPFEFNIPAGHKLVVKDANGTDVGDTVSFSGVFKVKP